MPVLSTTAASSGLAVTLAAVGAVLFGLAAVRQHGAVRALVPPVRPTLRERAGSGIRLVRQPAWLLGAAQAALGGGLHVVALLLAPITLVQPVGVLAVPVTVVASAIARGRRPGRTQTTGTLLSVVGVATLTLVLLRPTTPAATLPASGTLAVGVGGVLVAAAAVALLLRRAPLRLRGVGRAVVAAVLFGLVSVLVRGLGEVVGSSSRPAGLVVAAVLGLTLALPLGIWAMQSAYLFGSPQVVICCLTLVDPLVAVLGGRLLLGDGASLGGASLVVSVACALAAAAGVVLLSREYPVPPAARRDRPAEASGER